MLVSDTRTQQERLKSLINERRHEAFTPEYRDKATDAEALGLLISKYFEWDGLQILECLYSALEDANFHTENETIQQLIDKIKDGAK